MCIPQEIADHPVSSAFSEFTDGIASDILIIFGSDFQH